jgi:hypothetical protein
MGVFTGDRQGKPAVTDLDWCLSHGCQDQRAFCRSRLSEDTESKAAFQVEFDSPAFLNRQTT